MALPSFCLFSAALAILIWLYIRCFARSRKNPLPPGPPKLPLIGSVLSMPGSHQWVKFSEWAKQYNSNIIHLDVFGSSVVILNNLKVVTELFEKRSSLYSDRPKMIMATELMGWERSIFFQPYGNLWRDGRRLFHEQFQPSAVARFHPQELAATHVLLVNLLESPKRFRDHIRHAAGSLSMSIAYGIDIQPERDSMIAAAATTLASAVEGATPGTYLVDFLPVLKHVPAWFPGARFQRHAREVKHATAKMVDTPYSMAKQASAAGVAPLSFTRQSLETEPRDKNTSQGTEQEELIKWTASSIYVGATDTSVSAILSFFLGMLANPQAMRAAQDELDAVLKPGFLPTFDDLNEETLPYVSAIVLETLRCFNVTPMAIPHLTAEKDLYNGMRIPARSIMVANVWAMTHDEEKYPDPFAFKPERFLMKDENGKVRLNPDVQDSRKVVFGFGRRICPGMHLGYSFLWMVVASVLSCFDIAKAVGDNGEPIEPSFQYSSALVSFPEPFKCSIQARSLEKAQLIRVAGET